MACPLSAVRASSLHQPRSGRWGLVPRRTGLAQCRQSSMPDSISLTCPLTCPLTSQPICPLICPCPLETADCGTSAREGTVRHAGWSVRRAARTVRRVAMRCTVIPLGSACPDRWTAGGRVSPAARCQSGSVGCVGSVRWGCALCPEPRMAESLGWAGVTRRASYGLWIAALITGCNGTMRPPVLNDFDVGSEAAAPDVRDGGDVPSPMNVMDVAQARGDGPGTVACGGRGESCCQISCQAGLACMAGRCLDIVEGCGAIGRPCCVLPAGVTNCNAGLGCNAGICTTCGDEGQVCCTPDTGFRCRGARGCFTGVCVTPPASCGRVGDPCCGGITCVSGARCRASTGLCEPGPTCGDRGLPCCATGYACFAGICQSGRCLPPPVTCGRISQPCCPGDQCAVLYRCQGGLCQLRTPTCGDLGLPCCPKFDGCGSRLLCDGARCIERSDSCGVPGLPCCEVPRYPAACQPNVVCVDGTCRN